MDELHKLLAPSWGAEKWILEGWNIITDIEKSLIKKRMEDLFKDGLPFEMKHDKLFYIYTFSLLAQLEVLAIQVPLKFEKKMTSVSLQQSMRIQLLDEIFHGMVFTKIVYLLCSPYAQPPAYNEQVEELCNFIREEECPKVGVVLLNLIGEGWIEEIFTSLHKQNVAPNVFSIIIDDEHRHVGEADLYRDIGLPDIEVVRNKLDYLETQLISIFSQYKYVLSVNNLLGIRGCIDFSRSLDRKHRSQLKKLGLVPGKTWQFFLETNQEFFARVNQYSQQISQVEMTPLHQLFMTQWDNPNDPTMVGEFDLDISCLDFFNKKYASQTLTTLMLQAISQGVADNERCRYFLSHKMLYKSTEAYVALVIKLPECKDHIGNIVFENCHTIPMQDLAIKIKNIIKMMTYCYKKREQLENTHPHLKTMMADLLYDFNFGTYEYPMPSSPMVTLSNIGSSGYKRAKSPLRSTESMKFTLLEVTRKQVWNNSTQSFEVQDILPISVSADHRIFDGNMPGPKWVNSLFQQKFEQMVSNKIDKSESQILYGKEERLQMLNYNAAIEKILPYNLEGVYKLLVVLQSMWVDFIGIDEFFTRQLQKLQVESQPA